jgi:hypothetical protein
MLNLTSWSLSRLLIAIAASWLAMLSHRLRACVQGRLASEEPLNGDADLGHLDGLVHRHRPYASCAVRLHLHEAIAVEQSERFANHGAADAVSSAELGLDEALAGSVLAPDKGAPDRSSDLVWRHP